MSFTVYQPKQEKKPEQNKQTREQIIITKTKRQNKRRNKKNQKLPKIKKLFIVGIEQKKPGITEYQKQLNMINKLR